MQPRTDPLIDMSPSIATDFEGFKAMAGEFFRAVPQASADQIDNGHKALSLAYFGMDPAPQGHILDQCVIILDLAGKAVLDAEMGDVAVKGKAAMARLMRR